MRLRGKLGLLVGVPVTGALVLATLVLAEARRDAERATALGSVEHLSRVAERSTTLLRALQAERTSAVIPAASRERVAQGSLLSERIARVDSALAKFRQSVEKLDRKRLTFGTERAVKMTVTELANLPELRADIESGTARNHDRLGSGYGAMVEALIALVTSLREVSSDEEIAADVATLVSLLRVDEQEARLDALLGLVFSVGEFPPGSFRKLVAVTTEAKVHTATLQVDAGEVTRARFNASLTSGPGQEVSAIVAAALSSVQEIPKVDPNHWYVQHGQQITTLQQLEDRMLARIASRATQKKTERQHMVLLVLIVVGLAVAGSLALGWKMARSVHLSLASLHAVANRVRKDGDFSARVVSASADEVGQLGDAWNEMMAGIQARDLELADHRRHLEETVSQRTADLASERRRLALILTSVNEGIVGLDPNACVTFLNPAAERLLGLTASDAVGRPFHELVQHEIGGGAKCVRESCPILRTLNDGSLGSLTGDRLARSNGVPLVIEGSSTPIVVEGRTAGAVLSLRDVTAQKNLEFQLQQARKLEAIGQLAAGIAHEINTPMQFIGDNVRFLQEAVGDMQVVLEGYRGAVQGDSGLASKVRQSLEELEQDKDVGYLIENVPRSCESALMGVARVSKIVYAMKEFSHSGGEEKEPADLNRAIESTATVATSVWKHVAELELHLEADLPTPPVHLGEINQVILNLIINAAHAIADVVKDGAKGRITVSTQHDDTHVEIRVADTGTGIPESARDRIFTPFFTTKEIGKGTGQGLSLARSVVVDRHHGTIAFETETGRGTTFIVRLPLRDTDAPVAQLLPQ